MGLYNIYQHGIDDICICHGHNSIGVPGHIEKVCKCLQVGTYVCTDFTIVESSGESTLDTSHRPMHDATAQLVQQIVQEQGFTLQF